MNQPIIEEIISNIRQKLGTWDKHLWSFVTSNEMKLIIQHLVDLKQDNQYFVPSLPDAFHPYSVCPPEKVKCILITSLKSNIVDLAEGNRSPMQPNTETIRRVLNTIAKDHGKTCNWANEGVLQVSTPMTSVLNGKHHYHLWKSWISYLINKLNELYPDIPWIIIGNDTHSYTSMIKSPNIFIIQTWPKIWHNDAWNKVNDILVEQGKKPIKWIDKYKLKGTINKEEVRKRKIDRWLRERIRIVEAKKPKK